MAEFYNRLEFLNLLAASVVKKITPRQNISGRSVPIAFPGVNLAGGSFGNAKDARPIGQSHIYPDNNAYSYWAKAGFKIVRLSFMLERVQPTVKGPLDELEMLEIDRSVSISGLNGLKIILDLHNYGKRDGQPIASEDLEFFWSVIAQRYKSQRHVLFGIMNEPIAFKPAAWQPLLRATVKAIRQTGAHQTILAPGADWDGGSNFVSIGNSSAFEGYSDKNTWVEVHQYLDTNGGQNVREYVPGKGTSVMKEVTAWARKSGFKLFLGEFGFAMPEGEREADNLLKFLSENNDVWTGYTIWAAGPWWGDYPFSIEPENGQDKPQISILKRFM